VLYARKEYFVVADCPFVRVISQSSHEILSNHRVDSSCLDYQFVEIGLAVALIIDRQLCVLIGSDGKIVEAHHLFEGVPVEVVGPVLAGASGGQITVPCVMLDGHMQLVHYNLLTKERVAQTRSWKSSRSSLNCSQHTHQPERVSVVATPDTALGFDMRDGKMMWRRHEKSDIGHGIYCDGDRTVYASGHNLIVVDDDVPQQFYTGTDAAESVLWVYFDDIYYLSDSSRRLVKFDVSSRSVQWHLPMGMRIKSGTPAMLPASDCPPSVMVLLVDGRIAFVDLLQRKIVKLVEAYDAKTMRCSRDHIIIHTSKNSTILIQSEGAPDD
jgi:hypothetical protein